MAEFNLIKIYNPLPEDFDWKWDGKDYSIPAKSSKEFPEFMAKHFAEHLAGKILSENWELKVKKELGDVVLTSPIRDIGHLKETLLSSEIEAFEAIKGFAGLVIPPEVKVTVAGAEEIKPEVIEEVKPEIVEEVKPEIVKEIIEEIKPEVEEKIKPEIKKKRGRPKKKV